MVSLRTAKESGIQQAENIYRQGLLHRARRIVVKVGSAVLATNDGLNTEVMGNLVKSISRLHDEGREMILVTSGAVAAGRKKLAYEKGRELMLREKQALAAIGQSRLMHDYDECFKIHGKTIAQVLLTQSDLSDRKRYLNIRNTLLTLFKFGVIPVLNENDTVSTEELKFSDNDHLGSLVCNLIEADIFVCLTDVEALFDKNPATHPDARVVRTVEKVTDKVIAMAGNSASALGSGGMRSKILAAKTVCSGGGSSFIGPGCQQDVLTRLFAGEMIGTFFLPQQDKMQGRKRWIAYVLKPKGSLCIDEGACHALMANGRSLLPSGITDIEGRFAMGEAVKVVSPDGEILGVGLTNYNAADLKKILGVKTNRIEEILGVKGYNEVVHRDNLVLTATTKP